MKDASTQTLAADADSLCCVVSCLASMGCHGKDHRSEFFIYQAITQRCIAADFLGEEQKAAVVRPWQPFRRGRGAALLVILREAPPSGRVTITVRRDAQPSAQEKAVAEIIVWDNELL